MADYASEKPDSEAPVGDFEFRLSFNAMLSAKELFSDEFRLTEIITKKKRKKKRERKKKSLPDFSGIQPNFAGITVEGIILRKKKKVVMCVARDYCSISHSCFD